MNKKYIHKLQEHRKKRQKKRNEQRKKREKQQQQHIKLRNNQIRKKIELYKQKRKDMTIKRKKEIQKRNKLLKNKYMIKYRNLKSKGSNSYYQCQCNFRRDECYEDDYNDIHCEHNTTHDCYYHCGINLPPEDVCVPSRNYQFYQLPHFPIYDIGNYGSGLIHDMRIPFISPHAGMDMFTGSLNAPIALNPTFLSLPTF
jgi:hypothetical protein